MHFKFIVLCYNDFPDREVEEEGKALLVMEEEQKNKEEKGVESKEEQTACSQADETLQLEPPQESVSTVETPLDSLHHDSERTEVRCIMLKFCG